MPLDRLADILLASALCGYAVLLAWFAAWMLAPDRIHALHARWFRIERPAYDALVFVLLGLFKILVFLLFLVPWLAIAWTGGAR